jgi:Domain of unknown function (DUF4389)
MSHWPRPWGVASRRLLPSGNGGGNGAFGQTYPATLEVDRADRVANWRPIVQWLLAIPHWAILNALQELSGIIAIISWFLILFTGKLPEALANLQCLIIRYGNGTYADAGFLREEYPPLTFETDAPGGSGQLFAGPHRLRARTREPQPAHCGVPDHPGYPAGDPPCRPRRRGVVALVIAFFAVLFTGRWPEGLRSFIVGVMRWGTRVSAYFLLLTDTYPPFSLE